MSITANKQRRSLWHGGSDNGGSSKTGNHSRKRTTQWDDSTDRSNTSASVGPHGIRSSISRLLDYSLYKSVQPEKAKHRA